jgi:hypothetical protein
VQHEGEPFRRGERVQDHEQREAERVGQDRLVLRVGVVGAFCPLTAGEPIGSSRREARELSMFSATRATIVVSQPPRFSTPSAPERLSRSQVCCTASAALLAEPRTR